MIYGFIRYEFLLVPINNTLYYRFSGLDIILKNSRILFYLFICFFLNFIVFRILAMSNHFLWFYTVKST